MVIPILNEVDNVSALIERLRKSMDETEFIFVDDGSNDGTREAIKAASLKNDKFISIFNERRLGHMGSYLKGIKKASSDMIVIMDGDLQHPPEKLGEFYAAFVEGKDIIVGTRYEGKKFIGERNRIRGLLSRGAGALLKFFVKDCRKFSDPLSGFIGFRRGLEIPVRPEMKGNKLLPFLIVSNPNAKVGYVTYKFSERVHGKSKIVGVDSSFIIKFLREIMDIRKVRKTYQNWTVSDEASGPI